MTLSLLPVLVEPAESAKTLSASSYTAMGAGAAEGAEEGRGGGGGIRLGRLR
jgi:hypothetical protein